MQQDTAIRLLGCIYRFCLISCPHPNTQNELEPNTVDKYMHSAHARTHNAPTDIQLLHLTGYK